MVCWSWEMVLAPVPMYDHESPGLHCTRISASPESTKLNPMFANSVQTLAHCSIFALTKVLALDYNLVICLRRRWRHHMLTQKSSQSMWIHLARGSWDREPPHQYRNLHFDFFGLFMPHTYLAAASKRGVVDGDGTHCLFVPNRLKVCREEISKLSSEGKKGLIRKNWISRAEEILASYSS